MEYMRRKGIERKIFRFVGYNLIKVVFKSFYMDKFWIFVLFFVFLKNIYLGINKMVFINL